MIVYNPRIYRGLIVLLSCQGKTAIGALPYALFSCAIAVAIKVFPEQVQQLSAGADGSGDVLFEHPSATVFLTSLLGFLLVFRGNLAYARFWEARIGLGRIVALHHRAVTPYQIR
jgi:hypothetical protein